MTDLAVAPARGAARDAADARQRLVAAAAEVFAERGYDRAAVQEIARRAGLTTGAIYSRFSGKAELLREALAASSGSELDDLFAADGRQPTDVLATLGAHLVTRPPGRDALLLEAFVAARRDPEVAELIGDHLAARAEGLARLISEAKAAGTIDADLDTDSVVRFAHAVGLGFLCFEAIEADRPDAERWQDLVTRVVSALDPTVPVPQESVPPKSVPTEEA